MLKNWCFWILWWKKLLRVPWTARRSNQSILKEISPEYSLEGLKLKLQYFCHLMRRTDSFEKTLEKDWRERFWQRLKAEGEGDDRGWDGWMASPTQWTWVWVNSENWWLTGKPGVLQSMGLQRVRHNWATELKPLNFHCVSLSSICYYTISWRDLKKYIWIRLTPCLKSCIVSSHTWNKIQSPYFNLAWPLISPPSPGSFLLVNFNSAIRGLFLVLCHTELILPH